MRRHPLLMLCAIAALLVSGGSAGAAGAPDTLDFGVAPSKLQMKLIPGQIAHTDIDIVNKGDKPLTLDAYFNDYTISSGQRRPVQAAGDAARVGGPVVVARSGRAARCRPTPGSA